MQTVKTICLNFALFPVVKFIVESDSCARLVHSPAVRSELKRFDVVAGYIMIIIWSTLSATPEHAES